ARGGWANRAVSGRSTGPGSGSPSGPSTRTRTRWLRDRVDHAPNLWRQRRSECVQGPDPALGDVDESGFAQNRHVVRHGRLTEVEACGEVAHADGLLRGAQARDDLEASRVSQSLQDATEIRNALR